MAIRSVLSILMFIITYIVLVAIAIGITIVLGYLGFLLLSVKIHFITIMLALALMASGVFTLVFLVKFIFKKHHSDRSNLVRIKKEEHPALFAVIDDVVKEVGTHFPKRVYLSADINASVFYNSTFWSMIFPVRKNLQVGVGLINAVSATELKAILAHEFGHFSQRSMKVGSYVYNVNQVIHNMLFDNQGYGTALSGWANVSGYFSITSAIAVKIIEAIQYILRKVYVVVNLNYLALSREMEFHADAVAAHVTGPTPLISSLLRLSLADETFSSVLGYYGDRIQQNITCKNVYPQHSWMLNFIATENSLEIKHDLPQLNVDEMGRFNKSKLVIKDQWSSHPSTEDRVKHLKALGLPDREEDHSPATALLQDPVAVQERFTQQLFKQVEYTTAPEVMETNRFIEDYTNTYHEGSLPLFYNGYYNKKFTGIETPIEADVALTTSLEPAMLFNDKAVEMITAVATLEADMGLIKQIGTGDTTVKTFDYDGVRYTVKDCLSLLEQLEKEITALKEAVAAHDQKICSSFFALAKETGNEDALQKQYSTYEQVHGNYERRMALHTNITSQLDFLQHTTPYETIESNLAALKPAEKELKAEIELLLHDSTHQADLTPDMKDSLEQYVNNTSPYFIEKEYKDETLGLLMKALGEYENWLAATVVQVKRSLLQFQAEMVREEKMVEV